MEPAGTTATAGTPSVRGLEPGKGAALLISECQQGLTCEDLRDRRDELAQVARRRGIIPAIAELAGVFRVAGLPVMHSHLVPRADWSGFRVNCVLAGVIKRTGVMRTGERGVQPHPGLVPEPGDYVVSRPTGMTAFYGTDVDPLLRSLGVETVVVVGVSTNLAVLGSVIEAVNHGYEVVVPTDCIAGIGRVQHAIETDLLPALAAVTARDAVARAVLSSTFPATG
jgi:nicotinamidase-related amidase